MDRWASCCISTDLSFCAVSTLYPFCLFESHLLGIFTASPILQGGYITDFALEVTLLGRKKEETFHTFLFFHSHLLRTHRHEANGKTWVQIPSLLRNILWDAHPILLPNPLTETMSIYLNFKSDFSLNCFANLKYDITAYKSSVGLHSGPHSSYLQKKGFLNWVTECPICPTSLTAHYFTIFCQIKPPRSTDELLGSVSLYWQLLESTT